MSADIDSDGWPDDAASIPGGGESAISCGAGCDVFHMNVESPVTGALRPVVGMSTCIEWGEAWAEDSALGDCAAMVDNGS